MPEPESEMNPLLKIVRDVYDHLPFNRLLGLNVAYLKADSVAIVVAGFHFTNRVTIAVLQKDATAVIAIEVFIVATVPIKCQVLDNNVRRTFTRQ